jgi:hypothetical protein
MRPRAVLMMSSIFVVILGSLCFQELAGAASSNVSSWQRTIRTIPIARPGCFTATFPATQWRAVPCHTAPDVPFGPATTGNPTSAVGDGSDYSAVTSGGLLNSVTGSFPSVSAGAKEKGIVPVGGAPTKANTFSLQLNSSFFSGSPACAGASKPSSCQAWQQFVLTTSPDSAAPPTLFMQYWLLSYNATCPAGWFSYSVDCYTNSNATGVPAVKASELASTSLQGSASGGGSDVVTLTLGAHAYAVSNSDSVVHLASSWNTAEFGIFGDGDGTQASFSAGTTLQVMTATNNGTTLAPSCSFEGFTGETNNLNLVKTPKRLAGSTPAILSEQSNVKTSSATCVNSPRS